MPYLEFNQFFQPLHGQTLFMPHEMRWTVKDFNAHQIDLSEEADRRALEVMDKRFKAVIDADAKLKQNFEQKKADVNTENLHKELEKVSEATKAEQESRMNVKKSIF